MTDTHGGMQREMAPEEIQRRKEERAHADDMAYGYCESCGYSYHNEPFIPHVCAN